MKYFIATVLVWLALPSAQSGRTFVGVVSDDICGKDHSRMLMGANDGECAKACVSAHGASYALTVDSNLYTLSDQDTAERYAGKRVRVVGTLDAQRKTIRVESISADN